jgi:hypothetical protein
MRGSAQAAEAATAAPTAAPTATNEVKLPKCTKRGAEAGFDGGTNGTKWNTQSTNKHG